METDADFDGDGAADVRPSGGTSHLFLAKYDAGGALAWVRSVCGRGEAVALDGAGNVYLTGLRAFCADFDGDGAADAPGAGPFVAKYAPDGGFQWARLAMGTEPVEGRGVAADQAGNVYYTGGVSGRVDFSGDGVPDLVSTRDVLFLAKYDPDGLLQWVRSAGFPSGDTRAHDDAVSAGGAVRVMGYFEGALDFDGDGTPDAVDAGSGDAFVASYDAGGVFQWVKTLGGPFVDEGHAVAHAGEDVYATGVFSGALDLDADGAADLTGTDAVFLVRYDAAGQIREAQAIGADEARGLAADAGGAVYLAGSYTEELDLDGDGTPEVSAPGRLFDLFVAKLAAGDPTAAEPVRPGEVPLAPVLEPNYPNPFNPSTTIQFGVAQAGPVTLAVYDLAGRRIALLVDEVLAAGRYEVSWQAGPGASGVFVSRLTTGATRISRRMVLLR